MKALKWNTRDRRREIACRTIQHTDGKRKMLFRWTRLGAIGPVQIMREADPRALPVSEEISLAGTRERELVEETRARFAIRPRARREIAHVDRSNYDRCVRVCSRRRAEENHGIHGGKYRQSASRIRARNAE